jgi:hypothetical protein
MKDSVRINAYVVIQRAVEEGIAYGYMRAHKHTDSPSEDIIKTDIENAVMNEICDVLIFDNEDEGGVS